MPFRYACAALLIAQPVSAAPLLITGARVFDGGGSHATVRDVLIDGARIVRVARRIRAPAGTATLDARGLTLLPGLHDLHIHTRRAVFDDTAALERGYAPYLAAGVTSVNEFSVAPPMMAGIRAMVATGSARTPHLTLAARIAVPDGHGLESEATRALTMLVSTPAEARAAMASNAAARPDMIKVFADGWRYGDPRRPNRASIDLPTLSAIVAEAHARAIKVGTHTVSLAGLRIAVAAGVDMVVHGTGDARIDGATVRRMKARGIAYVPTLVVYEPQQTRVLGAAERAMLRPADRDAERARDLLPPPPVEDWDARRWSIMQDNVRLLHARGVRIGVGTDAGIAGVYHGAATLREIEWLTRLGFTPRRALAAATSVSATIMGARDHGRIAAGKRADLLLTGGRPDVRIADLYDVRRVFVAGREVDLTAMRQSRMASALPLEAHGE